MPLKSRCAELAAAASEIGLTLSAAQVDQLLAYLDLLAKWNRVYNLTAVRDPADMLRQHLVDSLAAVPALIRQLGGVQGRVLDVGSGAGLPGLVWAMALPELEVCCVDTVGKKASFMQQAAAELGLSRARSVHGRVEALSLGAFDVVSSRAFASLVDFSALTRRHLATTGVWLAMKGRRPDEDLAALPPDVEVFHVEQLRAPGLDAERCIVWMRSRQP